MRRRIAVAFTLAVLPSAPLAAQTTGIWSTTPRTEQVDPEKMKNPDVVANPGPLERMLVGTWEIWVPGGIWYSSDGSTVYRNYTPGAAMNRLTIGADGVYQWGSKKARLVEIRPWFAQPGDRYFAVVMDESMRYMARWDRSQDRLLLFFWGVGGHAATGNRIGKAPAPATTAGGASGGATPAGSTARPAAGSTGAADAGRAAAGSATTSPTRATHFTGTAVNSGVMGTALLTLTPSGKDSVRMTASFSGGLGGYATLQGTLRGEGLNVNGEMSHLGSRYTMIIVGQVSQGGELTATYSLTPRDRNGAKQGGTIQAWAAGATRGAEPAAGTATPAGTDAGRGASAGAGSTPTSPSNPLGVEWVGGNSGASTPPPPPPANTDPNCAPNALGVVWAQCKERAPTAAPANTAGATALAGTWRYSSLQVKRPTGEVQDYGGQVEGTFTLRGDGTFQQELRIGTQRTNRSGTYRVEGETLRLQGPNGATATLRFVRDGKRLWLEEEQRDSQLRFGLDLR